MLSVQKFDLNFCVLFSFFFFSSRRRHTRYWRDWSSDVCSSDLDGHQRQSVIVAASPDEAVDPPVAAAIEIDGLVADRHGAENASAPPLEDRGIQIGRASCRERV